MKNFATSLFILGSVLQQPASAQDPWSRTPRRSSPDQAQRDLLEPQSQPDPSESEERQHARYLESQFLKKAKRFAEAWNGFVNEYKNKRAFDVKKAKDVSKAFHELEKSEGWVKPQHK
jgi:hypothetical protein